MRVWIFVVAFFSLSFFSVADIKVFSVVTPTEKVKQLVEKSLAVVNDAGVSDKDKRKILRGILLPRFDSERAAMMALGMHYKPYKDRMDEFIPLFADLVEAVYLGRLKDMRGAEVKYLGEKVEDEFAEVRVEVTSAKGNKHILTCRLRLVRTEWKVYDILANGISMIGVYRNEFFGVLTRREATFDTLLEHMREKIALLKRSRR